MLQVDAIALNKDDGGDIILAQLNKLYLKDKL